jgi:C1A family cysteine protease
MPVTLQEIQSLIEQHKAGWIAGDNPFSRLSREERAGLYGAMEPRPAIPFEGPVHYHTGTGLPAHFDYRNIDGKNYVTPVRNQTNHCGACVAFACVGAIEATISRQQSHNNPTIHLSEAQLFFCYGRQDGANCTTPWWPQNALPHCVYEGLVDDKCFPYTPHDQPCNLCADWQNRLTKINAFAQIGSQAAIKDWLVNRGAVVVTMDLYEDFHWFIPGGGPYKHLAGALEGKHCMACIGYDDNAECWICKNSWGPDNGEQGFRRIGYGQCRIDSWDVFGVE